MKRRMLPRALALLLSVLMAVGCLPLTVLAAEEAEPGGETVTTVPHTQQDSSQTNYFTFAEGKWEAGNDQHVWSKAPDASSPRGTWYEVHFTGHKIDVYSGKNRPMGKVEYFIDGESVGTYSLYNGSNVNEALIATFDGLTEGDHVFRAEATGERDTSSTNNLIDCAKVVVYSGQATDPEPGATETPDPEPGATTPTLPAGNRWAYVNYTSKWGMSTAAYSLKLYKVDGATGTAADSMESGTYLICAPTTTDNSDPRWMHADTGNCRDMIDRCGAGKTVPGDSVTATDTAHQFVFEADEEGWYTIKSVANSRYLSTCEVGTNNQIPLSDTPTKFAVVKADGSGMFTIAAAVVDPDAPVNPGEQTEPLYGAIVDDDLQYVQKDRNAALARNDVQALYAWRNDTAVSQILLTAGAGNLTDVTASAGDFTGESGTISADNVDLSFIKVVKAYATMPGWATVPARPVPTGNRAEAAEVLMGPAPVDVASGKVQGLWVSVNVPEDAAPGSYTGHITVTANGVPEDKALTFTYVLEVAESVLPDATQFKDGFDIELWQNPYASAEYYGVTPFSEEHFAILRPLMEKYKSIGGHAITTTIVEEAWNGQTYSANEVHFPSMVKWSKTAGGAWSFDYTDFDAWVAFCKETIGIGDKVVCYSVAPWTNEIRYLDASGTKQTISINSSAAWNEAWTEFLTDLMAHMEEKGWKDETYIGIDERGFSNAAFDLIDSVTGTDGKPFKTAGAMDAFVNKAALAMRVDDLNVGSMAVKDHPTEFATLVADREKAGLRTTVYSCTGHKPGNFSLSAPGESYWTMLYSASVGGAGFLRWAYDSWVADPLRDTTHCNFEAGDCFLIFPDEKENKANPVAHSSLRLEKMAQGVRDVNKLLVIKENCPAMEGAVDALLASVKPSYDASGYYLTDAGKTALANDMKTLREGIATLTEEYEERLATGDTKKLIMRPTIPLVRLPEADQGNVDGPYAEGHARQYLGQPDMVMLPDETLVTVFPVGHGHGPLVMKKSEDRGTTWTELPTPESWARSLETPTMYRLDLTDGTQKYVMITARPNWDYNANTGKGGWDASVSDDGIHWSESTTYHEDVGYTIVAMASLIQLRDEGGQPIDKWMGVFHNYGFENYKTYLTFDEEGNMQWSKPEKYLSQYRAEENKYHICEVGMFRAPDDSAYPNRIMALARSDYHNNVSASTMFWSDDEGETWSKPVEMQGALAGERHKALYDPISGRLVIAFREIIWDTNDNGVFEGGSDWLAGDWVAWVGTFEDLMERNEGEYRILLDEDWANNRYSGDTGYSGVQVYPDGTFVLDSYGHWDKEFSQNKGYDVRQDRCWIRWARFTLEEMDALRDLAGLEKLEEIDADVLAKNARANSWMETADGADGGPAWAFDSESRWWHSNYGTATEDNIQGAPSASKPIWIQTGFDEARYVRELSYQPRSNGSSCTINAYAVQIACLDDPTAQPTDKDFHTVKTGNLSNTKMAQTITLDEVCLATHIRLVATGPVHGSGSNAYVTAQRIRIYATNLRPVESVEITGEGVADGAAALYAGDSLQLTAAVLPENANPYVTWSSSDPSVATVSWNGLVTARAAGEAVITAQSTGSASAAVTVTVQERSEEAPELPIVPEIVIPDPGEEIDETDVPLASLPFLDVDHEKWYAQSVANVVAKGLMEGMSELMFAPEDAMTRGMMAQALYALAQKPEIKDAASFLDLADGVNYAEAVAWGAANGIIKGYSDTEFGGEDALNRQQLAALLYRYAEQIEKLDMTADADALNAFPDHDRVSAWAEEAMAWAVTKKLVEGRTDGTLDPRAEITRAEAAAILDRFSKQFLA